MPFIPLDPSEYRRVQPLITEHERVYLPPTLSILEQVQPGEVYVDDRNHPTCAAVLRTSSMGGRLLGRADNHDFNAGLVDYLRHRVENDASRAYINISTSDSAWEDVIYQSFGYSVMRVNRLQFQFHVDQFLANTAHVTPPEVSHLEFHRVDERWIERFENLSKYVEALWEQADNYLTHGAGWIAVQDGDMKARCDSVFVGGGLAELSIHVAKSLRGRRVGYWLAVQFIRDCMEKGLTPNWTCDSDNVVSRKLAEKLGFTQLRPYFIYTSVNPVPYHEPARS